MPKASDLKKNQVIEIDNNLYIVRHIDVRSPTARGANTLYKVRFADLKTSLKKEETYKGDDQLQAVDLVRKGVQFSYQDGDMYCFMDNEDFSQYMLSKEQIEEQVPFLHEALEGMVALIVDGAIVAIDLPPSVVLEVTETTPSIKGATATKRTKPATLANGLVLQVPEYIATGDRIKVNTADTKYMSRE